jgi:thymidine phosphorylase
MKNQQDAVFLAELMVETGERMGKHVVALITDMDQPLGKMIGNALEVVEVIEILQGKGPEDLRELCLHLAGWMLQLGGASRTVAEGKQISADLISSGRALEKFRQLIELQGGDPSVIDDPKKLPEAAHTLKITSPKAGHVNSMQCEQIGIAGVVLGGGRERKEDSIDPAVGIKLHKKVGDRVEKDEQLATIHYNAQARAERARELIAQSYEITDTPPTKKRALIHQVIGKAAEKE